MAYMATDFNFINPEIMFNGMRIVVSNTVETALPGDVVINTDGTAQITMANGELTTLGSGVAETYPQFNTTQKAILINLNERIANIIKTHAKSINDDSEFRIIPLEDLTDLTGIINNMIDNSPNENPHDGDNNSLWRGQIENINMTS